MDDVPPEVVAATNWPIWRRLLRLPDDQARVRINAWREIVRTARMVDGRSLPFFPSSLQVGIFGESRVHWENLVGCDSRGTVFKGKRSSGKERVELVALKSLHGPLVQSTMIDDFRCDITDVEGISASKSADLHFDSVDSFGRYFNEKKKASLDLEGLDLMLRHQEIRIIHRPGVDSFGISMWDGRLFLRNHGGSHHFAGAAHIARQIRKAVLLTGRLHLHWLNAPAWEWLLEHYYVLQTPETPRFWSSADAARIAGECFAIELPPRFGGGEFALLPRKAATSARLIEVLSRHGTREVTCDLRSALDKQAGVARTVVARWHLAFDGLGNV